MHTVKLTGRHFQGVVPSRGLSPDASQDVAKVSPQRARIAVADGAGDTGGGAGEWAGILALSFVMAHDPSSDIDASWVNHAVGAWNEASNVRRLGSHGAGITQQELALLQRGVDASFVGAVFDDHNGDLAVRWTAAGDCEALLFRDERLVAFGPIARWADFTATARGLNSIQPQLKHLTSAEWELNAGDIFVLCSDALAQFILKVCGEGQVIPPEVAALIRCTEWDELRTHIDAWRQDGRLRNDDVAIVRVSIHDGGGAGRFSLAEDRADVARMRPGGAVAAVAAASAVATPAATPPLRRAELPEITANRPHPSATGGQKIQSSVPYIAIGTFIFGLVIGAMLPRGKTVTSQQTSLNENRQETANVEPPAFEQDTAQDSSDLTTSANEESTGSGTSGSPQLAAATATGERQETEAQRKTRKSKAEHKKPSDRDVIVDTSAADEPATGTTRASDAQITHASNTTAGVTTPPTEATENAGERVPAAAPAPEPERTADTRVTQSSPEANDAKREDAATPVSAPSLPEARNPPAPCSLRKGTNLYGSAKGEKFPLLRIEASRLACVPSGDGPAEDRRVRVNVWVDGGAPGADLPSWLADGRTPRPMNVLTAPKGKHAGSLRGGTTFTMGRREERNGRMWIELSIEAYRPPK